MLELSESNPVKRRRIGLTGGIATGKSTVARLLGERFGIPVLDADGFAREALAPGTPATHAVLQRYGSSVADPNAALNSPSVNRAALARIVFADPAERRWLEELVHPLVRARFVQELQQRVEVPTVALMIPLLFEAGLEGLCTEIWVVDCGSDQEQLRRLQARDGLSREAAQERLAAQWPRAAKLTRADVVIRNVGSPQALEEEVEAALGHP